MIRGAVDNFRFFILAILTTLGAASPLLLSNSTIIQPSEDRAAPPTPGWQCFPRRAPFPLEEIKIADCRQLVRDIAGLDPSGRKYVFGTADAPEVERTVPATYSRKTCIVNIIDMESTQAASDAFTMRYLSQKVARMADMCVGPPPHLGGESKLGAKGVLALVMVGVAEPDSASPLGNAPNATPGSLWEDFVVIQGGIRRAFAAGVTGLS